ncbi:MAG: c-type cytochrome [Rhodocyclales bacterium]|nr:c-type cytochrome [Rhodocyclales bacterium]
MIKAIPFALLLLLTSWQVTAMADAADSVKSPLGYGSKNYVWGKMTREQADILRLTGDAKRGKEAFRGCRGCHKADAAGIVDGTYPRLTGQHPSVVIKQVTEVRAGVRINPKMDPFAAEHAVSKQEIADISVYLATLETTRENGKGPDDLSAKGKAVYKKHHCAKCHGDNGEGEEAKAFPAVAAQHYGYLLREMRHIKDGTRGNSHPEMVKVIKPLTYNDLEAVADYLSRLPDYRLATKGDKK